MQNVQPLPGKKYIHEKGNTREKAKNKMSKYNDQTNRRTNNDRGLDFGLILNMLKNRYLPFIYAT
jgi:hypothetical protein